MLKPNVVVFDYNITLNSPAGSCVRAEVAGLCSTFEVTVFADCFEDPSSGRIRWVRVPCIQKPVVLRDWMFAVLSPLFFRLYTWRRGRPALVQTTQGQFVGADVAYAHFCHRAYLRNQWHQGGATGLRRLARFIGHSRNAFREARAFRRARVVVVPSAGLESELLRTYPDLSGRIVRIPNPVDIQRFHRPETFDLGERRREIGFEKSDIVIVFVALGDFARKGLRFILQGLAKASNPQLKLLVIGGGAGEISQYSEMAQALGVRTQTVFAGFKSDVRPYLWAASLFCFPTAYEIFPLAALQAAAAGLPLLATRVYGVEEFLVDGYNGWFIEREAESVGAALVKAAADPEGLARMGAAAQQSAIPYDSVQFPRRWRELFQRLLQTSPDE
jgi:glycosyltransferase involved in cell wall biosynthesis